MRPYCVSLGLRVQGGAVCKRPSAEGTVPAFVCVEEKGGGGPGVRAGHVCRSPARGLGAGRDMAKGHVCLCVR